MSAWPVNAAGCCLPSPMHPRASRYGCRLPVVTPSAAGGWQWSTRYQRDGAGTRSAGPDWSKSFGLSGQGRMDGGPCEASALAQHRGANHVMGSVIHQGSHRREETDNAPREAGDTSQLPTTPDSGG